MQNVLEQKYSFTESIEDSLNEFLLNIWFTNHHRTTTQLSAVKENVYAAEQTDLAEKDKIFLNKVKQFILSYYTH
ncbi:hypothetical protein [Paenibacillus agricola]|uniref:hypothetical protein n=1 Tax=Paenibacillus agricola TaxID=2716264 RepID=UPI001A9F0738|nr:hypothetical protein [Paenibacillus agricola]